MTFGVVYPNPFAPFLVTVLQTSEGSLYGYDALMQKPKREIWPIFQIRGSNRA